MMLDREEEAKRLMNGGGNFNQNQYGGAQDQVYGG